MTGTTTHKRETIRVTAILAHPKNPRRKLGDLSELTASIKAQGVLQDLVVMPGGLKDTYIAIAGHRRQAAAKKAGLTEVPCVIREDLVGDEAAQIQAMLSENLQRSDLNVVEEGDAFQDLLDLGVKPAEISKSTGRTQKLVKERAKIAAAPEHLRSKLIAREATLDEVLTLQSFAKYPLIYEHLAEYIGTHNWAFKVQWAKDDVKRLQKIAKVTAELIAESIRVLPLPKDLAAYRLERSHTLGVNLYWSNEPSRPDDAAGSQDVATTFRHGNPDDLQWCRLLTEQDADDDTPTAQPSKPKPVTDTPPADTDEDAEKAATQLAADLATAAKVRRDHLAKVLHDGGDNDHDIATACLRATIDLALVGVDGDELDYVAELFGIDPADQTADDTERAILDRAQKFNLPQLAILLRLIEQAPAERLLATPYGWTPTGYSRRDQDTWRAEVGNVFGHEWSDVELDMLHRIEIHDGDEE
ncbi:ParB/RepB/Spo0J family partition protein [Cellulomonas sp. NPDC058312]|uniref:ParB/RepB/Spo0J family partition protein n=1 Tax=Cellulomonas sp. NPDC058312 TaxID=3346441 RepID=UPI0036E63687